MQVGKTLLQGMLWRGLYYVTAFVINILIARHFEASVSGAVYYISSIYALALLFASLSIESGITYFAAKEEIPVSKLFNFSVLWSLVVGLASFLVVFFLFTGSYNGIPKALLVFSSVSFIFGNLLTTYCSGFFYAKNNFIIPNCINIISTICLIILLPYNGRSVIPTITDDNYFYIYFGSFFVQGVILAMAVKLKYVKAGFQWFLSMAEFNLLFRYCAMAFAGNILYFLLYRIDYWFVARYCTAQQLGNYIQVSKLGQLFFILPTILASAVFPITAGARKANIDQVLTLLSRCIFFLYLLACLLLLLTGRWLFPYIFGASFSEMYEPFVFLVPGILALSGLFTLTAYFAGKNQIKTNIIGSVYALIVILAGDIIFIPVYGINAAALVSSIGYIVYQCYIIIVFKKEYSTPLSHFFVIKFSDWQNVKKNIFDSIGNKKAGG